MWPYISSLAHWLAPGDEHAEPAAARSPLSENGDEINKSSTSVNTNPEYQPSVIDVIVTKAMLNKGLHLPPEIVDSIVDHAEYWPHTSVEADYKGWGATMVVRAGSRLENSFLIRSIPLGFPRRPVQNPSAEADSTYHYHGVEPKLPEAPYPVEVFQKLTGSPESTLSRPCRKIVFTFRSHDQGWSSEGNRDTYDNSWTWFEAGLERWCAKDDDNACGGDSAPTQPTFFPEDLSTVIPEVRWDPTVGDLRYQHPLLPDERLKIQCNKTAHRETVEHQVVWRTTDDVDAETDAEAADKLHGCGRGKETGNGKFVRDLRLGDVVTVWGKARFGAWVNYIEYARVDVYWAI